MFDLFIWYMHRITEYSDIRDLQWPQKVCGLITHIVLDNKYQTKLHFNEKQNKHTYITNIK